MTPRVAERNAPKQCRIDSNAVLWKALQYSIHRESEKTRHSTHVDNFVKY